MSEGDKPKKGKNNNKPNDSGVEHNNGRLEGKLTEEQKILIVQRLACFVRPYKVLEELKELYPNLQITKQALEHYDPTKAAGQGPRGLNQKLTTIFHETRRAHLADIAAVGIANQRVRLEKLDEMIEELESKPNKNYVLIAQLLEQAAKDAGNQFTNRQEINFTPPKPPSEMSDEELNEYRAKLAASIKRRN